MNKLRQFALVSCLLLSASSTLAGDSIRNNFQLEVHFTNCQESIGGDSLAFPIVQQFNCFAEAAMNVERIVP